MITSLPKLIYVYYSIYGYNFTEIDICLLLYLCLQFYWNRSLFTTISMFTSLLKSISVYYFISVYKFTEIDLWLLFYLWCCTHFLNQTLGTILQSNKISQAHFDSFWYSVMQSWSNSFWEDVILEVFINASRDEDNILDQIFEKHICTDFYYKDLKFSQHYTKMQTNIGLAQKHNFVSSLL